MGNDNTGTRRSDPNKVAIKERWNHEHYTQVKVSVDKKLVAAFKATCTARDVSCASVLASAMAAYLGEDAANTPKSKHEHYDLSKRSGRRKKTQLIVSLLELIMQMEMAYADRIPGNMQGGERHEAAEESVTRIADAIDVLNEAH
jgi:hypothetical protein